MSEGEQISGIFEASLQKKKWNIEMVYKFRPSDSLDLVVFRITSEMFLHPDQRPSVVNSAD